MYKNYIDKIEDLHNAMIFNCLYHFEDCLFLHNFEKNQFNV